MLLIGDIGGTKTDLAIYPLGGELRPVSQATFKSAGYASLEVIVEEFLSGSGIAPTRAVFGVAGPVVKGQAHVTNLNWQLAEDKLAGAFNLVAVKLLNDLEAIAHALPYLTPGNVEPLNSEQMNLEIGGNKAVIAPGTGLGEATLVYHQNGYHVIASEGGHTDFAPTTLFEIELLRHLLGKFNHVSYERVCSGGLGIPIIYQYLKENHYADESPHVAEALAQATDPTPVIIQAALKEESDMCIETLNIFMGILGSEAGNLALKVMATGGIYLGGGIPPKILPRLKDGTFMAAFVKKGRFSDMLNHIPVYVIMHPKPALLGALQVGLGL